MVLNCQWQRAKGVGDEPLSRLKMKNKILPREWLVPRSPSNWWNFKLTVFELTVHFKHEIIGLWQRFHRNFELRGISN